MTQPERTDPEHFAAQAESRSDGLVREFFGFLRYSKKWWLTPIIIVLLLLGVLVVVSGSIAAPFLYTLF